MRVFNLFLQKLDAYNQFLDEIDCNFVCTRLHAGIKAMQKMKRSIIISVDNRARDMAANYGLHVLERNQIENLGQKLIRNLQQIFV